MAMNVNIKEVRPRRHYFWYVMIFGLSILILIGVVLTKYDIKNDFEVSSVNIDPFFSPNSFVAKLDPSDVGSSKDKGKHRKHSDGSIPATKVAKETIKTRRNNTYKIASEKNQTALLHSNLTLQLEVHNVVYAKVHKAASSVIQNIILRFAMSRKLNVLMPKKGHVLSESSSQISKYDVLPLPRGEHYNILCNHVIFDKKQIERFIPKPTKFIGIIRHPMSHLSSALYYYSTTYRKSYYHLVYKRYPDNPVYGFLLQPYLYDRDPPRHSYVNNRMSIDLGFPISYSFESDKRNDAKITKFIADVDKTFDLILIVELFDESLILLRRLLHWKTEDVLYMKLNVRGSDTVKAKSYEKDMHRKWAPIDYVLYDHFRRKLEKEIVNQGEDFKQELTSYRNIQKNVAQFCKSRLDSHAEKLSVNSTQWSSGFVVSKQLCEFMTEGETTMVAEAKRRQKERHGLQ